MAIRRARAAFALLAGSTTAARRYNTNAARRDEDGILNVHVIAHTHDDVGWLKTVDEYYAGLNNTIQHASVRHILGSTYDSLLKNPDRKSIYVEQAFFQRWFVELGADDQAGVRTLVAEGRLSFINGGWCMHDEASTTYVDMVDQTQLGHRFIASEFTSDAIPSVTWQIDPFGHSGTQASLLSSPAAGYSALFVSRADYQDISHRTGTKTLEYVWQASESLGAPASTFFSIMNSGLHLYFPLPGMCWDALNCNDPEIQDDKSLDDYNVQDVVDRVLYQVKGQAQNYIGDVYITQGFDFNFEYAEEWFINLDKMIHYVNLNTSIHGVNMFYSTPTELARTKESYPINWSVKANDDGFPYADGPHSYWTGYFTSRAGLKGYVRSSSAYFQAAKQVQAIIAPMGDLDPANPLYVVARAIAVAQHHDAVAGTAMQHVSNDYAKRIARGRLAADDFLSDAVPALLGVEGASASTCDLANATICPALEYLVPTVVYLYNSQGQGKRTHVRIPVGTGPGAASFSVYHGLPGSGTVVTAQMLPLSDTDTALRAYYNYSTAGTATGVAWLAFEVVAPAVGVVAYSIVPVASRRQAPSTHASVVWEQRVAGGDAIVSNGLVTLTFSAATGMLSHFTSAEGVDTAMTQEWLWYNASVGGCTAGLGCDSQASGAYIFRTNTSTPFPVSASPATVTVLTGPVVNETRIVLAPWISQDVRLWAGHHSVEVEYTVGPVPTADGNGKEIVNRLSVPAIASNTTWTTDSNGRDMFTRVRNYRPSWPVDVHEPISSNYYPVNSAIQVQDKALALWMVNDRSQGGSSIVDGSIELMVHRRLLADDGRGVGEPLNEPGVNGNGLIVRGVHHFSVQAPTTAAASRRTAVQDVALFTPLVMFGGVPASPLPTGPNATALRAELPPNVGLLSMQSLSPSSWIVRLAHLFGVGEDAALSNEVTVDLANVFKARSFSSCTEMTLPGGQFLSAVRPVTYRTQDAQGKALPELMLPLVPKEAAPTRSANGARLTAMPITLSAMQVRTFTCNIA